MESNDDTYKSALKSARTLADFVRGVMEEKRLSLQDVSDRSRGTIPKPTVNDIKNGKTANPTVETLKALAKGLGVSEEEIFAYARGRTIADSDVEDAFFNAMGYDFRRLSEADKDVYRPILESIKEQIAKKASTTEPIGSVSTEPADPNKKLVVKSIPVEQAHAQEKTKKETRKKA